MTWPTGPPPMPPSGWYGDPDQAWTWRYWDGARWTDHRAPMWVPPARDATSLSAWFERSVAAVKLAVRRIGFLLLALWLALGIAGWGLAVAVFESDRGRELRSLLDIQQNAFGGSTVTAELTDAEVERAWELFQDIFWSALPWLVVLGVAVIVASAWSVALAARAVSPHVSESPVGDRRSEPLGALVGAAGRRVFPVIGSGVVVLLMFAGVWIVALLPVVLVAVAGGGGVAIVLTVVFVALLVLVVMGLLWVRLSLASVIAAVGDHGIGVGRSWNVTSGRFWYVAGRLVLTGLIVGGVSGAVNSMTGFAQFLGVAVYLAIVALLQALAMAASMIITVSGYLVTIDQAEATNPNLPH